MGGRRRLDPSPEVSRIAGGRRQADEAGGGWPQPARWLVVAEPGGCVPRQCQSPPPLMPIGVAPAWISSCQELPHNAGEIMKWRSSGAQQCAAGSHGGLDWRSLPSTCRWGLRREDEVGEALVLAAVAS